MRRWIPAALAIAVLLSGCGKPHAHLTITHQKSRLATVCAAADCGPYTATLNWTVPPFTGTTGYNLLLNGSQIGTAASSPFTFTGMDCGTTYTLGVQAHNGSGGTGPTYTTSYPTPVCSTGIQVGAPTPAGVTCTGSPLNAGANVQTALSAASPGDTVCLNAGAWSALSLSSISPASNVTLAATPGQTVNIPGISLASDNNLTVEGFYVQGIARDGIQVFCASTGGLTLLHNTIENISGFIAIKTVAQGCGNNNGVQNGVTVSYNQIDHAGGFMQIDGNACTCASADTNWTITHNVMGPGQDLGSGEHYIETQFVGATISNNAFIGPTADRNTNVAAHNNVFHCQTLSQPACQNVTFDNNILYYSDSRAQTLLISDNGLTNIDIENNLDVEDPFCQANDAICGTTFVWLEAGAQETLLHNTATTQSKSFTMGNCGSGGCFVGPNTYNAQFNISTGVPTSGEHSYGAWDCVTTCTAGNNVGIDTSANTWGTSAGANVLSWMPAWQTTSWPWADNGAAPPWTPPPVGYYQPTGISSTYGWQGVPCTSSVRSSCIGP